MGSLDRAAVIREELGGYEMEVFCNSEADLHDTLVVCKKNPGHSSFVCTQTFDLEDLPAAWQQQEILDYVRRLSDVTVRLVVGLVSEDRPEGAFFYKHRGTKFGHTASGWISSVTRMSKDEGDGSCPCNVCKQPASSPQSRWFEVKVETAKHVVYDLKEAFETVVEFGYDDDDNRDDVVKLTAHAILSTGDYKKDTIQLTCATHEPRVEQAFLSFLTPCRARTPTHTGGGQLCVIVSHPHGCCKEISVGFVKEETVETTYGLDEKSYVYDTATCPGCSGAPVLVLGEKVVRHALFPHSGYVGDRFNMSGPAMVVPRENFQTSLPPDSTQVSKTKSPTYTGANILTVDDKKTLTDDDTNTSTEARAKTLTGDDKKTLSGDDTNTSTDDRAKTLTGDDTNTSTDGGAKILTGNDKKTLKGVDKKTLTGDDTNTPTEASTETKKNIQTLSGSDKQTPTSAEKKSPGDSDMKLVMNVDKTKSLTHSHTKRRLTPFPAVIQNLVDALELQNNAHRKYNDILSQYRQRTQAGLTLSSAEEAEVNESLALGEAEIAEGKKRCGRCFDALGAAAAMQEEQLTADMGGASGWEDFKEVRDQLVQEMIELTRERSQLYDYIGLTTERDTCS